MQACAKMCGHCLLFFGFQVQVGAGLSAQSVFLQTLICQISAIFRVFPGTRLLDASWWLVEMRANPGMPGNSKKAPKGEVLNEAVVFYRRHQDASLDQEQWQSVFPPVFWACEQSCARYHHAVTQTAPVQKKDVHTLRFHREAESSAGIERVKETQLRWGPEHCDFVRQAQTYEYRTRSTQCKRDNGTQMDKAASMNCSRSLSNRES